MKTFWLDLTISIDAMHEESADNKVDAFLSAIDQKKNDKIDLVSMSELYEEGELETDEVESAETAPNKNYEEEWDDLSWEDLGGEAKSEDTEDTVEDSEEDSVEDPDSDSEDDLNAVLSSINGDTSADDDDDDDEDWEDFDDDWDD
jgi:hypothetical protein